MNADTILNSASNEAGRIVFVNPLQGTDSINSFSTGNTLPLIALPHGMTHWSAQTGDPNGGWFFHPNDKTFSGIRATHQPSPWMGDYASFVLMPQAGETKPEAWQRSSAFRGGDTTYRPDYYRAHLLRDDCILELVPTERCAVLRTEFLSIKAGTPRRLLLDLFPGKFEVAFQKETNSISGFTRMNRGGVPENFAFYFVIALDTPILDIDVKEYRDGHRVAVIELDPGMAQFTARIGTSFISVQQAGLNLAQEVGQRSLEAVKADATERWNSLLSRIDISGATKEQERTFYSCLYRALLFPRKFHEVNANGEVCHYSPYDGEIYPGVLYADNGFWDTFRTVYPLLSLAYPDLLGEIIEGWLNAYRESGWLPEWSSPGHRACMIGTHSHAVLADAVTKRITGFDYQTALEAVVKGATVPVPDGEAYGRDGLEEYDRLGYIPSDRINKATSRTMDYAYDDYCVAQIARVVGRNDLYEKHLDQSERWRNVFDPETKFFRGKLTNGEWQEPFDPYEWGGPFVEGSAWQFRYSVPQNPQGLAEVFGGAQALADSVRDLLTESTRYGVGSYGHTIHEMTEMSVANFGQYAQSNQPSHSILFFPAAVGVPEVTRTAVHRVLNEYYTPDSFPGDEDNGEMASWYVLCALGLLPLCPGSGTYVLNYPLFPEATITLPEGKTLKIIGANAESYDVAWNSASITGPEVAHAELVQGGELRFG